MNRHVLPRYIALVALLAAVPAAGMAAEVKGTDRQTVCSAARDQARKEAGKKVQLSECKCSKPAADGVMTCSVTAQ
ncbi:MAG: hypothetical protein AB7R90_07460 [Reyranellaceae bacterium]